MRRRSAPVLMAALLVLAGCGQTYFAGGGHVVGNGGDEVIAALEKGRDHARGVLAWLDLSRLRRTGGELDSDDEFILDEANKEAIRQELAQVRIELVDVFPPVCVGPAGLGSACTLPTRGATVWALRERCERLSVAQLGELLLHEVLHHFLGEDENRVYRLAARVYRGFTELKTLHIPKHIRQVPANGVAAQSIWDGQSLVSWNPYRDAKIGRYVPDSGWRETTLNPLPWWLSRLRRGSAEDSSRSKHDEVILYSPRAGSLYAFFYRSGFERLVGASKDFDMHIDVETGRWRALGGQNRAPRWGFFDRFVPGTQVQYGSSKDYLVTVSTFDDRRAQVGVFDARTERWEQRSIPVGGVFLIKAVAVVGDTARLVGRYSNSILNDMHVLRVNLRTFELEREAVLHEDEPRLFATVQQVNGGIVVFGGSKTLTSVFNEDDRRHDGAFLANDSKEWQRIPPNDMTAGAEGSLLIVKDRDKLHFFGQHWSVFDLTESKWAERPQDVGSFFEKMRIVHDAGDQMIFWNPLARDGFTIPW